MNIYPYKNALVSKSQAGFTMLEILVALVLGVGILTAAISMQVQHRKGFRLSSNQLEMQTNAKFVFEFLGKRLREASSMGCRTSEFLAGEDIFGLRGADLEAKRDEHCYGRACIAFNDTSVAYADFRPGYELLGYEYTGGNLTPLPPAAFEFVSLGQYNKNSDALTISGGYGEVYNLTRDQVLTPVDSQIELNTAAVPAGNKFDIETSNYGILSSCSGAKIFKITDFNEASGIVQLGGGVMADDNEFGQLGPASSVVGVRGNNREFRRAAVTTYYVGMDEHFVGKKDVPTLYQDIDGVSRPLIKGVEEIHFLYGLNENNKERNIADRFITADVIEAGSIASGTNLWSKVVSVRIGIIMRSVEEVYSNDVGQNMSLSCIDGYVQSPVSDKFSRSSYCSEVSLRNRNIGNRYSNSL